MIPTPVKVAVPAVLLAPVAIPVLHGIAGIAVVGLGLFAAGTIVSKTVKAFTGNSGHKTSEDDSPIN
jgi:hypothetical protein